MLLSKNEDFCKGNKEWDGDVFLDSKNDEVLESWSVGKMGNE